MTNQQAERERCENCGFAAEGCWICWEDGPLPFDAEQTGYFHPKHDHEETCMVCYLAHKREVVEQERYLPVECPICGRLRLLYTPSTHTIRCEKCYSDTDMIRDADSQFDRAEAAERREQALREYAQHLAPCPQFDGSGPECRCGLSAALEGKE